MDYIALAKLVIELAKLLIAAFGKTPGGFAAMAAATETKAAQQVRLDLAEQLDALAARMRQG